MQQIKIDRQRWGRVKFGEPPCAGYLLDNKGNQCCLGFWCEQSQGISKEQMLGQLTPCEVDENLLKPWHHWAIILNDRNENEKFTDAEQEEALIKLFAENGYELSFYN